MLPLLINENFNQRILHNELRVGMNLSFQDPVHGGASAPSDFNRGFSPVGPAYVHGNIEQAFEVVVSASRPTGFAVARRPAVFGMAAGS